MAGSPSYDFLYDSFLFDEDQCSRAYPDTTDAGLEQELRRYREHIDRELSQLRIDAKSNDHVRLLAGEGAVDLRLLAQCAWYVPEFIVRDPLYERTAPRSNAQDPMGRVMGLQDPSSAEWRQDVADAVSRLREMVPMVAAGYVRLLPISRLFEPPPQLPITHYQNGGADLLPAPLMQWFREHVAIRPIEIRDGRMLMPLDERPVAPRRSIGVEFGLRPADGAGAGDEFDPDPGTLFMYHLAQQRILSIDEKTGTFEAFVHFPDDPPGLAEFDAWVRQSVHQSAAHFADRTLREVRLADHFAARYLTRSSFAAEFLALGAPRDPDGGIVERTVNAVINLDVPFLEGVSIADLMKVRQEDGEAFQAFREALEGQLREVEVEADPVAARRTAENVRHELATVQLGAVERQVKRYRNKFFAEASLGIGSLLASVPTGGLSLIAGGVAAAAIWSARAEYNAEVKTHPAFFLWRVRRAARR